MSTQTLLNSRSTHPTWNFESWWPVTRGQTQEPTMFMPDGPLAKYDAAFGTNSRSYEIENNSLPPNNAVSWSGHCDRAALSVNLLREPRRAVTLNGVNFSVRDIKGLIAKIAYLLPAEYTFIGDRYPESRAGEPRPSKLIEGIKTLDPTLPLLVDIDQYFQVWTYPYDLVTNTVNGNEGLLKFESTGFPDKKQELRYNVSSDSWTSANVDFVWQAVPKQDLYQESAWPVENDDPAQLFANPKVSPRNVWKIYSKSI